jgi:hypothetical protein
MSNCQRSCCVVPFCGAKEHAVSIGVIRRSIASAGLALTIIAAAQAGAVRFADDIGPADARPVMLASLKDPAAGHFTTGPYEDQPNAVMVSGSAQSGSGSGIVQAIAAPEPSTWLLMLAGLGVLGPVLFRRSRRRSRNFDDPPQDSRSPFDF